MKKTLLNSLLVASAVLFLSLNACTKVEEAIDEPQKEEETVIETPVSGETITIFASIPEAMDTKVSFTQESGEVKTAWEEGDQIIIFAESNVMDKQIFTLNPEDDGKSANARFEGSALSTETGTFTIYYAGNTIKGTSYTTTDAVSGVEYDDQEQNGDSSTDHLFFTAMLTGVDAADYKSFSFSKEWATAHGATFAVNSIYKFWIQVPDEVGSEKLTAIRFNALEDIFYNTNSNSEKVSEIGVAFTGEGISPIDGKITAYVMASAQEVSVTAQQYAVTLVGTTYSWVKYFTPSTGTFGGGATHVIKLNKNNWHQLYGKGVSGSPFMIGTSDEFKMIRSLLTIGGDKRYFKLGSDIDFNGVADYTAQEFFNAELDGDNTVAEGKGYSITNLKSSQPLFGKIDSNATVKNLTIASSCTYTFTHSPKNEALYCGAIGRTLSGTVSNVTVNASLNVNNSETGTSGLIDLGGLIGRANAAGATISNSSFNGSLSIPSSYSTSGELRLGGIVGCITEKNPAVQVSNCSFSGVIDCQGGCSHSGYDNPKISIGGIVGKSSRGAISNCSTTDAAEESKISVIISETTYKAAIAVHPSTSYLAAAVGGIVGCSMDGTNRTCSISGCNNYSSILTYIPSSNVDNAFLRAGGIIGHSGDKTTITNCNNYGTATHISTSTTQCLGGVIGYDKGAITKSYNQNAGSLTVLGTAADLRVGGIIGDKAGGTVTANSSNPIRNRGAITVTAQNASSVAKIGGLFGNNTVAISGASTGSDKDITNNANITVNQDVVTSNNWAVGGVVGYSSANLSNISNNGGTVSFTGKYNDATAGTGATKNACLGGVLGLTESGITISNCTNAAKVTYAKSENQANNECPSYVGGIVGKMASGGTISSCTNSKGVNISNWNNTTTYDSGAACSGGIVGALVGTSTNLGSIVKCQKTGTSTTNADIYCYSLRGYLGAIAGYVSYTTIGSANAADACTSESYVTGVTKAWCGGLVGMMVYSSLKNSTFTGSLLNTKQKNLGGLVFSMDGNSTISGCTFNGALSDNTGLSGFVAYSAKAGDSISDCKIGGTYNGTAITSSDITNAKICASGSPSISNCSLYSE